MKFARGLLLGFCVGATASAATFTVTNTADSGAGSLRDAITQANTAAGADTIAFNVSGAGCDGGGVCTIAPASPFPTITGSTLIDGFTQPGSSTNTHATGAINAVLKIVVSGQSLPPGSDGFHFNTAGASGSTVRGLVINGGFAQPVKVWAPGIAVQGCFIGTDASGMIPVGNGHGIYADGFFGASGLTVGGAAAAERNLFAGQTASQVYLNAVPGATIRGNLLGTDKTGAAAPGAFPMWTLVINVAAAGGTVVRDNVIAGGTGEGVQIGDNFGSTLAFFGNFIGTDTTGTVNLGNPASGIRNFNADDVTIGGTGASEANIIAFNGGAGVLLYPSLNSAQRCTIRGNSIHSNHQNPGSGEIMGIDLGETPVGGLTENDLGDGDTGPNGLQNFPIITSAVTSLLEGGTTITGKLNSAPDTQYTIDFYGNSACIGRPQALREGRTYLGSTQVTTDGSGNASINAVVPTAIEPGGNVTATATDPDGNTSEFSQRIVISASPGSGDPAGVTNVALTGFHFLAGAGVAVEGVAAPNVVVNDYDTVTITTPNLPPGSLNDITLTNTDGTSGTLPNGWIADFLDVNSLHIFYTYVTTLVRNEITVGVGGGNYGVNQNTLRQQMAVFLLKSKYGICYVPPPCTVQVFPDVPCSSGFAPWINQLVAESITGGCGGGLYCPTNPVNRQQMAVFLLKTLEGSGYTPPACTAATFTDVPCGHPFATWIYELVARNITAGCGGGNYCPLTNANRGQMATFIVKTFGLQ
jgi:Right handed beta helix region/S-layer homology domain